MLARRTSRIQTYSGMYCKRKGLDLRLSRVFPSGMNWLRFQRGCPAPNYRGLDLSRRTQQPQEVTFDANLSLAAELPRECATGEDRASIGRRRVRSAANRFERLGMN